jgi:hypothetical protein
MRDSFDILDLIEEKKEVKQLKVLTNATEAEVHTSKKMPKIKVKLEKLQDTDDVILQAQGLKDIFSMFDKTLLDKIMGLVDIFDIYNIKEIITMLYGMIEVTDSGDIYLNIRIKLKD